MVVGCGGGLAGEGVGWGEERGGGGEVGGVRWDLVGRKDTLCKISCHT